MKLPENNIPTLLLSFDKDKDRPTGLRLSHETININPLHVVGWMTLVLEHWVDQVPENQQNNFESLVLEGLTHTIKNRHHCIVYPKSSI